MARACAAGGGPVAYTMRLPVELAALVAAGGVTLELDSDAPGVEADADAPSDRRGTATLRDAAGVAVGVFNADAYGRPEEAFVLNAGGNAPRGGADIDVCGLHPRAGDVVGKLRPQPKLGNAERARARERSAAAAAEDKKHRTVALGSEHLVEGSGATRLDGRGARGAFEGAEHDRARPVAGPPTTLRGDLHPSCAPDASGDAVVLDCDWYFLTHEPEVLQQMLPVGPHEVAVYKALDHDLRAGSATGDRRKRMEAAFRALRAELLAAEVALQNADGSAR